jgi:hypothetical protein
MYASDDVWDEFVLMDSNVCLKLGLYCNSLVLIFQYLPVKFNFCRISPQCFGFRSLFWYFLSLWFQKGGMSVASSIS